MTDDAPDERGADAPPGTGTGTGTDASTTADDTDDPLAWTTTASEVDYACPGFEVRRDEVRYPDGRAGEYHSVDEPPAVVILPLLDPTVDDAAADVRPSADAAPTADGRRVVLVEEWRQAVGRVNRGLPAGTMEPGEDVETAARRELAEETGHEATTVEPLVAVEPANGVTNAVHHHVLARGCTPTAERDLDHNESIRVAVDGFAALVDAAVRGDLRDGRAVTALLVAVRRIDGPRR